MPAATPPAKARIKGAFGNWTSGNPRGHPHCLMRLTWVIQAF
jgi:hypothetical protein